MTSWKTCHTDTLFNTNPTQFILGIPCCKPMCKLYHSQRRNPNCNLYYILETASFYSRAKKNQLALFNT